MIPLIKENVWRDNYGLVIPEKKEKKIQTPIAIKQEEKREYQSLEEEALDAVLKDAKQGVPIIALNKVPGIDDLQDENEKYLHDVSLRPDECTEEDYERVPIEQFGMALLKGMGWEKGKPVGKNPHGYFKLI